MFFDIKNYLDINQAKGFNSYAVNSKKTIPIDFVKILNQILEKT